MESRVLTGISLALASLSLPAQSTWIVDAGGGGQFTDIAPAVQAAAPGDTVLVRAGVYRPFVVDRGIEIVGGAGVETGVAFDVHITVRNVPAGQTAVVRGLTTGPTLIGPSILVTTNAGRVHVEDMQVDRACVMDSSQVSWRAVRVAATTEVERATVSMSSCELGTGAGVGGEAGLDCRDSRVTLVATPCHGTDEVPHYSTPSAGLRVDGGTVIAAGGVIEAGASFFGSPVPAAEVLAGELVVDPSVQLFPQGGSVPVIGSGQVSVRDVPSASAGLTANSWLATSTRAPGSSGVFVVLGFHPPAPVPTPFGDLWFDLSHVVLGAGSVSPAGTFDVTVGPMPAGELLVVQSAVVYPGARLELAAPTTVHVEP